MEKVEHTGQESFSAINVNNTPTRKPHQVTKVTSRSSPLRLLGWGYRLSLGAGLLAKHWKHSVERVDPELSFVRAVSGMRPPSARSVSRFHTYRSCEANSQVGVEIWTARRFLSAVTESGVVSSHAWPTDSSKTLNNMKDALACCVVSFRGSWTCLRA